MESKNGGLVQMRSLGSSRSLLRGAASTNKEKGVCDVVMSQSPRCHPVFFLVLFKEQVTKISSQVVQFKLWSEKFPSKPQVGVSKNRGTPKSSILIRFSIINHPFWGTTIFGNIQVEAMELVITIDGWDGPNTWCHYHEHLGQGDLAAEGKWSPVIIFFYH